MRFFMGGILYRGGDGFVKGIKLNAYLTYPSCRVKGFLVPLRNAPVFPFLLGDGESQSPSLLALISQKNKVGVDCFIAKNVTKKFSSVLFIYINVVYFPGLDFSSYFWLAD